ncbi:hypothetical protein [Paracoccus sp. (in: a-proteobacteria)]|uniref:hypothetical protein n=1 Tax=Paracoccus sp. TaxID=267 RepID=UPI0028A0D646|nr:hypothetical protein [Paracoccus sp. (in: a-proteobacteria)]
MFAKTAVAALALAIAAPAFASDVNPGNAMMGELLNVDASQFTTSELGQIAAEKGSVKQQERARFILEEKAQGLSTAVADDNSSTYFGLNAAPRVGRD